MCAMYLKLTNQMNNLSISMKETFEIDKWCLNSSPWSKENIWYQMLSYVYKKIDMICKLTCYVHALYAFNLLCAIDNVRLHIWIKISL